LDPYGKRELLAFYDRHLDRFGDTPQALRWTALGQQRRYGAFLKAAGPLKGRQILDFGCGKGDLLGFLAERGLPVEYTGIDVNEKLVALARRKYPGADFIHLDIEEEALERSFDVVLICGVFNLRIAGIAATLRNALKRLFPLCREALHLNIPSSLTGVKDPDMYYADPFDLLRFALEELSPEVALHHGLLENEIFLSVYNHRRPRNNKTS